MGDHLILSASPSLYQRKVFCCRLGLAFPSVAHVCNPCHFAITNWPLKVPRRCRNCGSSCFVALREHSHIQQPVRRLTQWWHCVSHHFAGKYNSTFKTSRFLYKKFNLRNVKNVAEDHLCHNLLVLKALFESHFQAAPFFSFHREGMDKSEADFAGLLS